MSEQMELDLDNTEEGTMTWRYGVAEYWYEDAETGKTSVDRAELIEVFDLGEEGGAWSDTSMMSDSAETMLELANRITRDVDALKGKADVIVIVDSRTWKDKCWWWAHKPEKVYEVSNQGWGDDKDEELA